MQGKGRDDDDDDDDEGGPSGKGNGKMIAKRDKPSKIGEILAEQISRRVVILVLMVLFVSPQLQARPNTPLLFFSFLVLPCTARGGAMREPRGPSSPLSLSLSLTPHWPSRRRLPSQVETDTLTPQRLMLRALREMDDATRRAFVESDFVRRTGSFKSVVFLAVRITGGPPAGCSWLVRAVPSSPLERSEREAGEPGSRTNEGGR